MTPHDRPRPRKNGCFLGRRRRHLLCTPVELDRASRAPAPPAVRADVVPFSSRRARAVGFFNKIKSWLNIGGVKVRIEGLDPKVSKSAHHLDAKVVLTT